LSSLLSSIALLITLRTRSRTLHAFSVPEKDAKYK
jgi:hypothetical protein